MKLNDLIAYVDRELSPEDDARVEKLLSEDPRACEAVAVLLHQRLLLAEIMSAEQRKPSNGTRTSSVATAVHARVHSKRSNRQPSHRRRIMLRMRNGSVAVSPWWIAACAASVLGCAVVIAVLRNQPSANSQTRVAMEKDSDIPPAPDESDVAKLQVNWPDPPHAAPSTGIVKKDDSIAPALAKLQAGWAESFVRRAGAELTLSEATDLQPGDVVGTRAAGKADIVFADGTRILLGNNASLRMGIPATEAQATVVRSVQLDQGGLDVIVAPQRGSVFLLRTPHAEVRVLGTRFKLAVEPSISRVTVHEGRVRFTSAATGESTDVSGKQYAVVSAGSAPEVYASEGIVRSFQDGVRPSPEYMGTRNAQISRNSPNVPVQTLSELEASQGQNIILLRWDLTPIPSHSRVVSAVLVLHSVNENLSLRPDDIHVVKRDWQEGEATWLNFAKTRSWKAAGGRSIEEDRERAAFGRRVVVENAGRMLVHLGASATAALQKWVDDPSSNFGILFDTTDTNVKGLHLCSRTAEPAERRPRLVIRYLPWGK